MREVDKAKTFPTPLDYYAIVTTAKTSTNSQLALLEINREHQASGLFTVVLITWDQINDFLNENSDVADEFYGGVGAQTAARLENKLDELVETARVFRSSRRETKDRPTRTTIRSMRPRDIPRTMSMACLDFCYNDYASVTGIN